MTRFIQISGLWFLMRKNNMNKHKHNCQCDDCLEIQDYMEDRQKKQNRFRREHNRRPRDKRNEIFFNDY